MINTENRFSSFKKSLQVMALSSLGVAASVAMAEQKIMIGALVSGQVSQIFVEEGQAVKQGQKLINLDAERYQAKKTVLQAQLKLAEVTLKDARIELDQALDLFDRTVTSKRTLDAAQLKFDQAQALFNQAKGEMALHRSWAKYVYIKAPVDATVVKIHAPKGSTVFKENTPMIELK